MAAAELEVFLGKLHEEMKTDSEDYRTATGNRKLTTLTHKNHKIRAAINGLIQLNNSKDLIGRKDSDDIEITEADNVIISKEALNTLVRTLTDRLRVLFKNYAEGKTGVEYKKLRGGFSIKLEAHENDDKTRRSNYKAIQNHYRETLNTWYTEFLEKVERPGGLLRKSTRGNEVRRVSSGGKALNLTHEKGSNVLHQMNDALFKALDETYGASSDPAVMDAELKKWLDTKEYKTFLEITKNGRMGEVHVSISSALLNAKQGAGALEQGLVDRLQEALGKALVKLRAQELTGSDSLVAGHRKKLIKELVTPFKGRRGIKVKHEDFEIKESKSPTKISKTSKAKIVSMGSQSLGNKKKVRKRKERKPKPPRMALANILGVLNSRLPETVANNMGAPRLENRTGRFAQSVRATDVTQTSQGFPSIGYTYMKNRYGVYESTSGTRYADVERDPRPLIDQSIREIVIGFGLGRIYTRRQ